MEIFLIKKKEEREKKRERTITCGLRSLGGTPHREMTCSWVRTHMATTKCQYIKLL